MLRAVLLLAALLGAGTQASAQAQADGEVRIKAAFLYQFGGFVEWPPQTFDAPDSPFVIGVVGADAMAQELQQVVVDRTVQGRPVVVRRLEPEETPAGLHVLFVGRSEATRLREILAAAKDPALLVVTDFEDALSQGSMINFVAVDNRVRFDVALWRAERDRLKISSRLLGVARKVVRARS